MPIEMIGTCVRALVPKPPGAIRLVCQSDTHGLHDGLSIPDGDIYIHAGDFSSTGTLREVTRFESFLASLPHPHKVCIAGNHDITFDSEYYRNTGAKRFHRFHHQTPSKCRDILRTSPNVTYLEDSGVEIMGIRFWGSPWQPEFCNWAFNLPRCGPEIRAKWALIPQDVDVLVTHGPAHGNVGGVCADGFDAGCEELTARIRQVAPLLHVSGHIHEGYGVSLLGETVCVNASCCTLAYKPSNAPIVVDLLVT